MPAPPHFPVSVKGIVVIDAHIVLLQNERDEWELPGGKLEYGEDPEPCLARELVEELSVRIEVGPLIDVWVYPVAPTTPVVIVTYACTLCDPPQQLTLSHEHQALHCFPLADVPNLRMPDGYKRSIARYLTRTVPS
ncbi:MAG: NUDIX domain-containing protein [Deltaproteobacteria bacterium]|nr:NUDIX domain-containing protein [Deltaproteobacteria bacterium]